MDRRPRRVRPHKGGEQLHDRPAIGVGIARDPGQRVNAADADGQFLTAELIDRLHEAFGDLRLTAELQLGAASFAAYLDLPPGEIGTQQQHYATKALQESRTDGVSGRGQFRSGQADMVNVAGHQVTREDKHAAKQQANARHY